jgi:hypothetical protein
VPYQYNFLTVLEERLRINGLPVEIINMGIPGTSPREYLSIYLHEAFDLDADIILLCVFVGNDFEEDNPPPLIQSYIASLIRYVVVKQRHWKGNVIHGENYNDEQPRMSEEKYLEIEVQRSLVFRRHDPLFARKFKSTVSYIETMRDLCHRQQCDVVVVAIPDEMQVNGDLRKTVMSEVDTVRPDEWDFSLPNRLLASELQALNVTFIDLLDAFKTASEEGRRLYRMQDSHWNIAGNRLAAEVLSTHLSSILCRRGLCGKSD